MLDRCNMPGHLKDLSQVEAYEGRERLFAVPHKVSMADANSYFPVTHASCLCQEILKPIHNIFW